MRDEPHVFHVRTFVVGATDGGQGALDALARIVSPLGEVVGRAPEPYWKSADHTELNVEVVMPRLDRGRVDAVLDALGTGWEFCVDDDWVDATLDVRRGGILALPGGTWAWAQAFPLSARVSE